jgi:CheY-like chemotaxis protein
MRAVDEAIMSTAGPLHSDDHVATAAPVVLVVDDDELIRRALGRLLTRSGFSVIEAHDGTTAIAAATDVDRLDLVLCDINLPDIRGNALVARLATLLPRTKVTYLSGDEPTKVDLTGATFVAKPVRSADLLRHVRALIGPGEIGACWVYSQQ